MRTKRTMMHNLSVVAVLTLASLVTAGVTLVERFYRRTPAQIF